MSSNRQHIALLHYSAPPTVGGVESVIYAHADLLQHNGYAVSIIAGRGAENALPAGVNFVSIPLIDSQHPAIERASDQLENGHLPTDFAQLVSQITAELRPVLTPIDTLIVHNVFTKHFNLALTAALFQLLDEGVIGHCIAWSHDFTWTSPNSRSKVFEGEPWDLLRTYRRDVTHVVVSAERQRQLASLYDCPPADIHVVYNGVDAAQLWGLGATSAELVTRLGLLSADLILLMPVRVTQAKNVEFALELVAALKNRNLNVKLIYTGPPDPHDANSMAYYNQLRERRTALGLDDHFHFVYESDPASEPLLIDMTVVSDLLRVADLLVMTSHREGFGMPILEAGLLGKPIVASTAVPAASELGEDAVLQFDLATTTPTALAQQIDEHLVQSALLQMARRVRQRYTWDAIFRNDIEPLLIAD